MISLNFISIVDDSFEFTIYRKLYEGKINDEEIRVDSLPVIQGEEVHYQKYYVSFDTLDGYEPFICNLKTNFNLSLEMLFRGFSNNICIHLNNHEYFVKNTKFEKEVRVKLTEDSYGFQYIGFSPYYLASKNKFGFLVRFGFSCNEGIPFSKEIQKRSLSLDNNGFANRRFYRDVHSKIMSALKPNLLKIKINEASISLSNLFTDFTAQSLQPKTYILGGSKESSSQFMGIRENGPYKQIDNEIQFIFLFDPKFRVFANDLYLSLIGTASPGTFPGMNRFFHVNLSKDNVSHIPLNDYSIYELDTACDKICQLQQQQNDDKKIIVLFIEPNNFDDLPPEESPYYYLKYRLTKKEIPIQVINSDRIRDKKGLKWAASNIALQIFAKSGGIPWIIKPQMTDCLILGIGSVVEKVDEELKRFFAYCVCLNSSGIYEKLEILADENEQITYLESLQSGLKRIFGEYSLNEKYRRCVLHLPFKIKQKEIDAIQETIKAIHDIDFQVVKINTHNRFFGFSEHNTLVPYESSYIKIASREYLVWFEGLQYGKENIHKRIGGPVHIQFLHGNVDGITDEMYLQDVLNLSGANWRGFNAKQEPISVYYAKILANYNKAFENFADYDIGVLSNNLPWFL